MIKSIASAIYHLRNNMLSGGFSFSKVFQPILSALVHLLVQTIQRKILPLSRAFINGTIALFSLWGLIGYVQAQVPLNFKPFQTEVGEQLMELHNALMIAIIVIFVGVFYFMFHSLIMHRKSVGHKAAKFHENLWVEIIWTAIPMLILVGMAIPTTKTLLDMRDNNDADMIVKVTGYQFKWRYEYMDGEGKGLDFFSNMATPQEAINNQQEKDALYLLDVDNPLVVPAGKKTKLLITSNDVLHAFWVPELAIQQVAIPGYIREISVTPHSEGTYRGQCSELCGANHAFMPIVVKSLPEDDFNNWAQKKRTEAPKFDTAKEYGMEELKTIGKTVYQAVCVACHQPNGQGIPGAFPALAKSSIVTGDQQALLDIIVNGRSGTAMAAFGKQIGDVQLAAVATYIRNHFDNAVGDMIQPSDIKDIKAK